MLNSWGMVPFLSQGSQAASETATAGRPGNDKVGETLMRAVRLEKPRHLEYVLYK